MITNHKIVVRNSSIIINNYKKGDAPRLEYNFQLYDRITRESYYKAIYFDTENERLFLPRGVDISYLETTFNTNAYLDTNHDKYDTIEKPGIKYKPRDERQYETINFMLGLGKYNYTKYKSQMLISAPPGAGKTFMDIFVIAYSAIKACVITSSVNYLNQWRKCILEYTAIKPKEIYLLSGGATIDKILSNKKKRDDIKIYLISDATLKAYASKNGWDKVSQLFKLLRVGIKTFDESHLHFDTMAMIDFYTNTYKTYYLSATPSRSDEDENIIYQLYFKNIPSVDMFDKEQDPHTHYLAIKFNTHPSTFEISKCKNMYGLNRSAYINYLITKESYYNLIIILLDIVLRKGGKTLIYIGVNKAIKITKEWIELNFPELIGHIGVYTSLINENKKEQLNKKIILSTVKSCGAAMDIKGLKNTIVLADPFKSGVLARQSLGRTRDSDTWYIDIVDIGFASLNKWYYAKKSIFAKYACSTNEMVLTDDDMDKRLGRILCYIEQSRQPLKPLLTYNPPMRDLLSYDRELKPLLSYDEKPFSRYRDLSDI